jgi:predicted Zn-dependent peptidase
LAFISTPAVDLKPNGNRAWRICGHLNAYTARDHTTFYARVLGGDLALGVDMVSDLILNPTLDPAEIVREKDVILQEMGQAWDTPDDIIFDHLAEAAFPDHPLGRPILGVAETLAELGAVDIRGYLDTHYRAGSMVLAAAGKVDHDRLVGIAEARLSSLPPGLRPKPEPAAFVGGERRDERALEQTHVTLAFPGVPHADPEAYAAMLFSTLLGGGMSSRLFQDIREDRGLVYTIYSYSSPFAETGMLTIYLGTDPERAQEAVLLTADAVRRAVEEATDAELDRARAQLKASLFMSLESCSALSEQIGRNLLVFDRVIPTQEIVERINSVTVADVRGVGDRLIRSGPLALATVGPSAAVPDVQNLAARLA